MCLIINPLLFCDARILIELQPSLIWIAFPEIHVHVVNVLVATNASCALSVTYALFIVRRKLVLYPNGDKSRNGDGYISLYLVIADTTGFPPGWEINAIFKLFVYDQLQDKYLTIGGMPFLCMLRIFSSRMSI